jgi:hypothetical protein
MPKVSMRLLEEDILEIETARTLSDAVWPETSSWTVRSASVKGSAYNPVNW